MNMTYKEAAQILKTHEGTVKSRMYYLKGKLREEIAKGGGI
jgi:DNA-directed RNA polymerase specialized sigma24 family protein